MIQNVKPEHTFWLKNGKQLKNITELNRELNGIETSVFEHHVNNQKNDFADWIEFCIQDKQLATLVRSTKNAERMRAILERKIQQITEIPRPVKQTKAEKKQTQQTNKQKPAIIISQNITKLELNTPKQIIQAGKTTQLKLKQENKPARTGNITKLQLKHDAKPEIIKTKQKTPLKLVHAKQHIIKKGQTTQLHFGQQKEIYFHEVKKAHHSSILLLGHTILGIVAGVAAAMLIYALT